MAPEEPSLRVTDKLAHPELGYVRLPPVNIAVFVSINFYVITMNFSCLFLSQSGMGDLRVCEYRPGDIPVIHPLFKGEESILCGDDGLIFRHMAELVRTDHIAAGIDVRGGGPKGGIGPDPLQGVFNSGILKREAFDNLSTNSRSSRFRIRSNFSTVETLTPRRLKAEASSAPIGPPPRTMRDGGNFSRLKIVSL